VLQPKTDNLALLTSVLFLSTIYFTDGCQTASQDRLDVYFIKVNIQDNFGQKARKEREEGENINNLVLPLLIYYYTEVFY